MVNRVCCLLLAGVLSISASTDVSLKGTVKDESGTAVPGAIVTLAKKNALKDTTDAQGMFELATAVGVALPYGISAPSSSRIKGIGNTIQFSLTGTIEQGNITLFSSNGRQVTSINLGAREEGTHAVALPELAPGFYVLQMAIGQEITTRKLMNTGNRLYISKAGFGTGNAGFAKQAASADGLDTLIVTREEYTTAKLPLDTYTKNDIAVVLKKGGAVVECPELKLPAISAITYSNKKHPGPFDFKYMDLPRVTTKALWECRRTEIWEMAQEYLYGHLPPKCEVQGTVSGGSITAKCTYNGKTVNVSLNASGSGDILVIDFGMGAPKPPNSRSASASGATFLTAANNLYGTTDMGICMASAWGVGRIIDALEQNPNGGIDAKKVITTGCSTNGKQALIAGVFEPRVAICMPVEGGCGGTCSWRVSSEYGHGDSNTDCQDITHLETNWTGTVTRNTWERGNPTIDHLPFDQGELMALRAPRPMMAYDNGKEQYKWLCNRGNTAAAQACHWIYKALGVSDNFGFVQPDPGHGHCSFPSSLNSTATAFFDKFLSGKTDTDTHILTWNKESEETAKWFEFGTGEDQWDTTMVLE